MPKSVMGRVLWVDLTEEKTWEEIIPDDIYNQFLSGVGLAAALLYHAIPPGADPLGPENVLGFVSGLLNGTNSLFSGRWMVVGKSPLTGAWGEANCGGTLAPAIKRSGYDGIFIRGASRKPLYLTVQNRQAVLHDAGPLWGLDTVKTEDRLHELFPNSSVACIGPAGEKRSLMAGICNDSGRLAARSGLGAVMGSKGLKAIVLCGNQKVAVHDPAAMQHLSQRAYRWTKNRVPLPAGRMTRWIGTTMRILPFSWRQDGILYQWMLRKWGTISMNQISVEMGDAPIRNWRGSNVDFPFSRSETSDPDRIIQHETKKYHCRSCALGCGGITDHPEAGKGHKPEYETVLSWGGLLGNEDLASIFRINERLNRAGMDSISAGGTVAFAIECAEQGRIGQEQLGGLDLHWGNAAAIEALVDRMINRQGIGDLLADGSQAAAARLPGSEVFAIHAGGQELAMHDGRNDPGFALHAVVEPMPGRHTNGSMLYYEMFRLWTQVPGLPSIKPLYAKQSKYRATAAQAAAAVACSRFSQIINGAGICLFGAFLGVDRLPVFQWLNAATGWNHSPSAYMQIGARIQAVKQLFNARQGVPLRHSIHPRALGIPKQTEGANRGVRLDFDAMVRGYWIASGWDPESGMPTVETLWVLGLAGLLQGETVSLPTD